MKILAIPASITTTKAMRNNEDEVYLRGVVLDEVDLGLDGIKVGRLEVGPRSIGKVRSEITGTPALLPICDFRANACRHPR